MKLLHHLILHPYLGSLFHPLAALVPLKSPVLPESEAVPVLPALLAPAGLRLAALRAFARGLLPLAPQLPVLPLPALLPLLQPEPPLPLLL